MRRFWSYVDKSGTCWLWTGSRDINGYGRFFCKAMHPHRTRMAHRFAFQRFVRSLAPGECVMHTCDNPPCVNPEHLRAGSIADNNEDMFNKGRAWQCRVTHCPRGHEYTEANTSRGTRGGRVCVACRRLRQPAQLEAKRRWAERRRLAGLPVHQISDAARAKKNERRRRLRRERKEDVPGVVRKGER